MASSRLSAARKAGRPPGGQALQHVVNLLERAKSLASVFLLPLSVTGAIPPSDPPPLARCRGGLTFHLYYMIVLFNGLIP